MKTQERIVHSVDQVRLNEDLNKAANTVKAVNILLEGYNTRAGFIKGRNSLPLPKFTALEDLRKFTNDPDKDTKDCLYMKADEKERQNKDRERIIEQYSTDAIDEYLMDFEKNFSHSLSLVRDNFETLDFKDGKFITSEEYLEAIKERHTLYIESEAQEQILKSLDKIVNQVIEVNKLLKSIGATRIEFKTGSVIDSHFTTGEPMINQKTLVSILKTFI